MCKKAGKTDNSNLTNQINQLTSLVEAMTRQGGALPALTLPNQTSTFVPAPPATNQSQTNGTNPFASPAASASAETGLPSSQEWLTLLNNVVGETKA